MANILYAAFTDAAHAEKAAGALLDNGVRSEDLSFVAHEGYAHGRVPEDAEQNPGPSESEEDPVEQARTGLSTTTPQDAATGALEGVSVGLQVGLLAALMTLFVPGVGIVLGGGALAAALGAAAATTAAGALAGSVVGYLKDQGVPEPHVHHYQSALEAGGAVLAVHLPSGKVDAPLAEEILAKYEAAHVGLFPPAQAPPPPTPAA